MNIRIGILGATSYTGLELVHLLTFHPDVVISFLSSRSHAGVPYSQVFPEMRDIFDTDLLSPRDAATRKVDCVFSCLPHAVSAELVLVFVKKGIRVIDLSADFRIKDTAVYSKWYGVNHPCPEYLDKAVYGLPEHYRNNIRSASIVANPGCYPTGILLPLLPLLRDRDIEVSDIIADSKSGVSGAGRSLKLMSHFVEAHETVTPYSIGRAHRHVPEIDQELSAAAGRDITITFSPHLVPTNRGILSTIYFRANKTARECGEILRTCYLEEPFVRVREPADLPRTNYVAGTNLCDIAVTGGDCGGPLIAVSALDNLLKGASGQAVQNMNIMFDMPEHTGLLR